MSKLIRAKRGSTLGLVAMCTLLIIIALGAAFQLMIYLGSSQELKNSVDAGSLNVAMRASEIRVPAPRVSGYDDVADCNGRVGLSNINRVWGKAYLINANAQDMGNTGYSNGDVSASSKSAYDLATRLNDQLYNALTSGASADVHFNQIATNKPAKLLKTGGDISSSHEVDWATACVYPGEESNISFDPASLPPGTVPNQIKMNDKTYLQGYNGMDADGRKFCFSTFHSNEAPHLITVGTFEKAKNGTINSATRPIPNAFKAAGQINGNLPLNASAAAVANPMLTYQLQLPRSFVEIVITNYCTGKVQAVNLKPIWYSPSTGKKRMWPTMIELKPPGEGKLTGYGILGQEYRDLTLWGAIHALPGDKTAVMAKLLQRVREMRHGYTDTQLKMLLQKIPFPETAAKFHGYIYCNDSCNVAANQLPELQYGMHWEDDNGGLYSEGMPAFIPDDAESLAEGNSQDVGAEQAQASQFNVPYSTIIGPYPTDVHTANEYGVVSWKPGTGFNMNLGVMTITRTTNLFFSGLNPNKYQ
ncbi:MAG: hypothetical protein HYX67_01845 [Candidatus Melainabacteria bacterium]|nr:hypothetical protein [Candidatus Melainabacteria bacterium]